MATQCFTFAGAQADLSKEKNEVQSLRQKISGKFKKLFLILKYLLPMFMYDLSRHYYKSNINSQSLHGLFHSFHMACFVVIVIAYHCLDLFFFPAAQCFSLIYLTTGRS